MNQQAFGGSVLRPHRFPSWSNWIGLLVALITLIGTVEYLEADTLFAGIQFEELFIFQLMGYANLLLIGSTVLYVSHLKFTSEAVGRWASSLAALGALTSIIALSWRWFETYYLHSLGHLPLSSMYDMMTLFSAVTVVIYLVMERVYHTRSAGAFVMLIVFASVLFEIWLAAHDYSIPGSRVRVLKSYWMYAHVLGNFIGYGAFAVAAAMGGAYLLKDRADARGQRSGFATYPLSELTRIDTLMHKAILLGFPVFTVATVLGSIWAYEAWGRYWAWDPKETWALLVWLTYAPYFYFCHVREWSSRRMAWWAIAGFAITVFCFLGTRAFSPGLHALGQVVG
jgi:cytochrome c-type biogenesis protein CcsB